MKINVNKTNLYYINSGIGVPLILIHGNGEDHHIFDKISIRLQQNFTVYAIDSRNHGQSDKTADYTYETMAEDIYEFIETLHLGKVNVIGFSDGAIISLVLSMKHGEVINKMALLGVNLKPDDFTEESYQYIKETYEETKDPLFKMMLEQPNIELEDVRNINIPALIIAADQDIYRPEMFVELVEAFPNAVLKIMEGHDHDSYISGQDILYPDFIHFFCY